MSNQNENIDLRGDRLVDQLKNLDDQDLRNDLLDDYAIEHAVRRSSRLESKNLIKQVIQQKNSKARVRKLSMWVSAIAAGFIIVMVATTFVATEMNNKSYSLEVNKDLQMLNELFVEQSGSLGFADSLSMEYKMLIKSLLAKDVDLDYLESEIMSLEGDEKRIIEEYMFLVNMSKDESFLSETSLSKLPEGQIKNKYSNLLQSSKD